MPIQLPPITTAEGVLSRLLIAESRTPAFPQYNADEVRRGMQAMKAVVDNRLRNHPERFGATGATSYMDIITAAGQFHGFSKNSSGSVAIASDVQHRIDDVLAKANTGPPGRFFQFVDNANNVVSSGVNDPFAGLASIAGIQVSAGAYGWRSENASDPGDSLIPIPASMGGVIQGNKFYALKGS